MRIWGSWRYISFKIVRLPPLRAWRGCGSLPWAVQFRTARSSHALSSNWLRLIGLAKVWVLQNNIDIIQMGSYRGIFRADASRGVFPASLRCNSMLVYIINSPGLETGTRRKGHFTLSLLFPHHTVRVTVTPGSRTEGSILQNVCLPVLLARGQYRCEENFVRA